MKILSHRTITSLAAASLFAMLAVSSPAPAQSADLINMLTSQLGISAEQASGGAGALMNYAKQSLDAEKFAEIANAVPDLAGLVDAAPAATEGSSAAGQLASALGESDSAGTLNKLAGLQGGFDKLGMSPEQITQFVPVVLDYAKSMGGDAVSAILKQALPAL